MTEPQKSTNWWQTLPGLLAALTALLTAITGLVALLFQNGILGEKDDVPKHTQSNPQHYASPAPVPERTFPVIGHTEITKSWSDAVAVVINRDGTTTRLRATSLSNCISVAHDILLESGQSVPFEKMSGFEVLQADDHTSPNPKAKLKIKLLDGTEVSGTVEANCDLFGYNNLGRFSAYYDNIRSIHFE